MRWVGRIHEALEEGLFRLYFQTIKLTNSTDEDGLYYETPLRMADKDGGGDVPPGAFLPAAERYNLSPNVDRWVIKNTLK